MTSVERRLLEKLEFFKEYGELFWDEDAIEYGAE